MSHDRPPDVTERVTLRALELGYRHVSRSVNTLVPKLTVPQVDSAKAYKNELESATAIRKSGLDRSQVFYTSKVPRSHMGYESAKQAIEESIAAANLSYIDL